jgi:hypothetical protein
VDPYGLLDKNPESDGAAADAAKAPAFQRTPSREERVIFGGKVEKTSKVHLELEVYRFK